MRILFFANTDWYLYNYRLKFAQFLRERGHEVMLLSPPGRYSRRLEDAGFLWQSFPLQRKGTNPIVEGASILRLVRVLGRHRPDLVHFFTIKPVLYGSLAAKIAGVPRIVNAVTGLGTGFSKSRPLIRRIVILLYRLSLRGTRVIFQNPDDQDAFIQHDLVTRNQSIVIPSSGVDLDVFCSSPEPPGRPVIMLAGRLLRSKGVPEFVEASKVLRGRGYDARFVLVGEPYPDNPETIRPEELEHFQKQGVELWGWHDDMERIIPLASILCLPTTYNEGLPRILLEAAACERPVIATDVPGCRLAVRHGETGLLVAPNDPAALTRAMESLLNDAGLRRRMGRNAREYVNAEFSVASINHRTIEVYPHMPSSASNGS